ncbi:hypothetical protein B7495_17670 [Cryobacterium sp. LW097]|nr:hypothetical protein B7495_17670 [Cryobacterium sp. LW097]
MSIVFHIPLLHIRGPGQIFPGLSADHAATTGPAQGGPHSLDRGGAVESLGGSILPDAGTGPDAETLARLREQRRLLRGVRDGVEESGRRLAGQASGGAWRSPAQRAYGTRLGELGLDLAGVWRALDDALWAVDEAIDRLKAAL